MTRLCKPVLASAAALALASVMAACASVEPGIDRASAVADADVILTGPLTFASIPDRFVVAAPLPLDSRAALAADLARRGKLTLSQAKLDLSPAEPHIIAADELRLSDATLTTAGSDLSIYVRRLVVDDRSRITSFGNAPPIGEPGAPGVGGGHVHIYVLGGFDGLPHIVLDGGTGGPGGPGAKGSTGTEGPRGHSAHNGSFGTCQNGPGGGGRGGVGGRGGEGEAGFAGGPGGVLQITFINQVPSPGIATYFSANGGRGGTGGPGGQGGNGGPGGLGGANAGNCQRRDPERNRGATGPSGPAGPSGPQGPTGAQGNAVIERIDIPT